MNAQVRAPGRARARVAVLGSGTVGSAFVQRWESLRASGVPLPGWAWLANSRVTLPVQGDPLATLAQARAAPGQPSRCGSAAQDIDGLHAGDVVVDATASDAVAARHVAWLERGIHVVTANKLAGGGPLARAQAITAACHASGACHGDSATVGAGLPLLDSVRRLVAGGDRIHAIEGVLSGSLAWLFDAYDDTAAFSAVVQHALRAGYTEPDPRVDLSGEDVRRKLLVLGRSCGWALDEAHARVASLVPAQLVQQSLEQFLARLPELDAPLRHQLRSARATGAVLRFIGRVDAAGLSVGLQALAPDHLLAQGAGTDNRVVVYCDRYREQPLLIQGPGAGAAVTAAALWDDVLAIGRNQSGPLR